LARRDWRRSGEDAAASPVVEHLRSWVASVADARGWCVSRAIIGGHHWRGGGSRFWAA